MTKEWWIETALSRAKSVVTSILVIAGFMWLIGEPSVRAYIKSAIAEQGYATKDSVLNLSGKVLKSGQTIGEVRDQQIRQQEQLKNIEKNTENMNRLLLQLLQRSDVK